MEQMTRAVLFLSHDVRRCEEKKPLMLESVLFCPLLTWVSEKLKAAGVERFFVVCGPEYAEEVRACFDGNTDVVVSEEQEALKAFLEGPGAAAVFPAAELPIGPDLDSGDSYAYVADAAALKEAWTHPEMGQVPGARALEGFAALYSFEDLQELSLLCRDAVVEEHIAAGVAFIDRYAVYIDPRVRIGAGTVILPGTILRGNTTIGQNCEIGPNTMIRDCTVGDDSTVNASQLNQSSVGNRTSVGPFAYIRPGCTIGDDIKVGDFVEVKNSVIGNGTKISHLTYVGDSDVGRRVNFGCGTVTTNYDGFQKYRTTVGDDVFIGCNTNLVAPVRVGDGAYIAAGATLTEDVPADALAIARARQTVKEGWAARNREKRGRK